MREIFDTISDARDYVEDKYTTIEDIIEFIADASTRGQDWYDLTSWLNNEPDSEFLMREVIDEGVIWGAYNPREHIRQAQKKYIEMCLKNEADYIVAEIMHDCLKTIGYDPKDWEEVEKRMERFSGTISRSSVYGIMETCKELKELGL